MTSAPPYLTGDDVGPGRVAVVAKAVLFKGTLFLGDHFNQSLEAVTLLSGLQT